MLFYAGAVPFAVSEEQNELSSTVEEFEGPQQVVSTTSTTVAELVHAGGVAPSSHKAAKTVASDDSDKAPHSFIQSSVAESSAATVDVTNAGDVGTPTVPCDHSADTNLSEDKSALGTELVSAAALLEELPDKNAAQAGTYANSNHADQNAQSESVDLMFEAEGTFWDKSYSGHSHFSYEESQDSSIESDDSLLVEEASSTTSLRHDDADVPEAGTAPVTVTFSQQSEAEDLNPNQPEVATHSDAVLASAIASDSQLLLSENSSGGGEPGKDVPDALLSQESGVLPQPT